MLPAKVTRLVLTTAIVRLLLPRCLRLPLTLWRYRRYFAEGLRCLWQGRLGVPVLDALAIGAGILIRSYGTANSIMLLLKISDILQQRTLNKTHKALRKSLTRHVNRAWLLTNSGNEISVPLRLVSPGSLIVVRTGALIPVDGQVTDGEGEVNEALMTGEFLPARKSIGSRVYAGTVLSNGRLIIRVEAVNGQTRITRIINMAERADGYKSHHQADCEHLADRIVPWSLLAAAMTWILSGRIGRASSVLMVDYSCALKLTTPIVMATAMRQAIKRGVLVKGGKYLEALAAADTVIFDKTGTLTSTTPEVSRVLSQPPFTQEEVLRLTACIEEHFQHSMAQAIVKAAAKLHLSHHEEVHGEPELIVARGIRTKVKGKIALVGSEQFLFGDEGIIPEGDIREQAAAIAGESVIWLAVDGKVAGAICLRESVRREAADVIRHLRLLGLRHIIMLTGDTEQAAFPVAEELGIDEYYTGMSPEEKAELVCRMHHAGHHIILVGDGVNDSPAMSCAQAAVAMKDAADLAHEVADITLLEDNLHGLIHLRLLAVAALARIHNNYRFIALFNSALIALGAFGIFPPLLSAWLHNLSTVGACMTSRRPLCKS